MKSFACSNPRELSEALAEAHRARRKMSPLDLSALDRVVAHAPEDMTVTVETGLKLSALQEHLRGRGQWLPLDPRFPVAVTIEQLVSHNLSGPRRCGYGTVREHLIGMRVALADGRLVRSGGRVVKNVAGYDLAKLFVGARRTLGIPVEATFKLLPLPEEECLLQRHCASLEEAGDALRAVDESALTPVVMDLRGGADSDGCALVLGLAGTREEVAWQVEEAGKLRVDQPADWSYETDFWQAQGEGFPSRRSVAPSRLARVLGELDDWPWLARARQGAVFYHGPARGFEPELPMGLMRRLKQTFDPHSILPDLPW